MNQHAILTALVLLVLAAILPPATHAGDEAKMEAWVAAMTPGEMHEDLARQAGEWRYVVTFWNEPGGEPTVLEGVAIKTMVMGGRYLQEELSGEFDGRPFRGFGLTGYDNVTKELVGIWIDNTSTGINHYLGERERNGSHTYRSTSHDPATGKPIRNRSTSRVIDADHHTYESYMQRPDGTEHLQMRVEYTRASN